MSFKGGEHREELVDYRAQDHKVRGFNLQKQGSSNADQYLQIDQPVIILSFGFGSSYTFASIRHRKGFQTDLNDAILQHMHSFEGNNNLLIVYYGGYNKTEGAEVKLLS